ncbi:hypothetical protein [Kosmotoga pacifica]|uniref:Uncharacterized protein n=1 Tax=Kosmotoga pacifica TaxID=1330330 RepID=A0A0G2Z7Q5_9BACT|nr:hypothetical protein [Kosmotoga pacifica]AKI97630.1 hypothetical protein IX53_07155 [Kosmotoga pacifica]
MNPRVITFLLIFFAALLTFISVNTAFGFYLTETNPILGAVIFINALIYFFGLLESHDDPKRREAHLLIGSYFSYLLAIFQVLLIFTSWLNGRIEGYCAVSLQSINLPLLISGFIASFVNDYVKKAYN